MTYWEAFTQAKDKLNPDSNEDRIVVVPDRLYAVIDGATDKSGRVYDGLTGGQIAGRIVEDVLRKIALAGPETIPASAIFWRVNRALARRYRALGIAGLVGAQPWCRFSAQASIAIRQMSGYRFIVVGDTGMRLNGREVFSGRKAGDIICAQLRVAVHRALTDCGAGATAANQWARTYTVEGLRAVLPGGPAEIDAAVLAKLAGQASRASAERLAGFAMGDIKLREIEVVLMDGLKGLHRFRNQTGPLGFASIDGSRLRQDMIIEFERPAADIDTIELYSDGYPAIPRKPTVAAWEAEFRKVERADPERIDTHPDTKGSSAGKFADDRAVLVVRRHLEGLESDQ